MSLNCKIFLLGRIVLICILLLLQSLPSNAQNLPAERAVNWSLAGLRGPVPTAFSTTLNINNFGGDSVGVSDNSAALQLALSSLPLEGGVIFFPKGTYFFSSKINLPDRTVIRGEGSNQTTLLFDLGGTDDLIAVIGTDTEQFSYVTSSISKNETIVEIENTAAFNPGDYIQLIQKDSHLVYSDWAIGSTGQIAQVVTIVNDSVLLIDSEWRKPYNLENQPRIQKINMRKNAGIECLKIERLDETNPIQTSHIKFQYAAQCWVKGVESINCNFAHVDIRKSCNNTLTGNYFHHAFNYGGGGRAYGVMIQSTGSENLVENNIFEHLRHSMIVQSGANGNVFAYNYSIDPFWTGTSFPENAAGDLVCHGNYTYCNLFEGNVGQQIVIDNSHGTNGPFNTFFRNRVESYGIVMSADNSPSQNFIGNEIPNGTAGAIGFYFLQGVDHFEVGNNLGGEIIPIGTNLTDEYSCYLDTVPLFYNQLNFPGIGFPNELNTGTVPAMNRWISNNTLTICNENCFDTDQDLICDTIDNCHLVENNEQLDSDLDGIGDLCDNCPEDANADQEDLNENGIGDICEEITTTIKFTQSKNTWRIYPNPANKLLILEFEKSLASNVLVQVYSTLGQLILEQEVSKTKTTLSLNSFPNGNYIIRILDGKKNSASKLFTISRD